MPSFTPVPVASTEVLSISSAGQGARVDPVFRLAADSQTFAGEPVLGLPGSAAMPLSEHISAGSVLRVDNTWTLCGCGAPTSGVAIGTEPVLEPGDAGSASTTSNPLGGEKTQVVSLGRSVSETSGAFQEVAAAAATPAMKDASRPALSSQSKTAASTFCCCCCHRAGTPDAATTGSEMMDDPDVNPFAGQSELELLRR